MAEVRLKNIKLLNFKNYAQVEIDISPGINCFVGNNGVGKTNLLDAIHYLSLTKSYFNSIDSQNIRREEDFFLIEGGYQINDDEYTIHCSLQRGKKKAFKKNKKDYQKLSEHIGFLPLVIVTPSDSALINDGSEERRKFMNNVISQYNIQYLNDLMAYNRLLVQRNQILKDADGNIGKLSDALEAFDFQLIKYGENIVAERKSFVTALKPIFQKYYQKISGNNELVSLNYKSDLLDDGFEAILKKNQRKDLMIGYTSAGAHRDDLIFELDGYPIKKFGSQGQQKTYLVALKLAKYDYIRENSGKIPILLLDDIFDKFDRSRVKQIIEMVAGETFGQIFITDTDRNHLNEMIKEIESPSKIFNIEEGGNISTQ